MEKNFNLVQALLLEEELENLGHWVVMTRRTDRTLSLAARAKFANVLVLTFLSAFTQMGQVHRVRWV